MNSESSKRKPPAKVHSIDGRHAPLDVITDADHMEAVKAQALVLKAQKVQDAVLDRIRARLANGATDRGKRYFYDDELAISRRRDQQETGS